MNKEFKLALKVVDYTEHALSAGSSAKAVSYIQLAEENSGKSGFGVGVSSNITRSSVRAIFSAMNRLLFPEEAEAEGKRRVAEERSS